MIRALLLWLCLLAPASGQELFVPYSSTWTAYTPTATYTGGTTTAPTGANGNYILNGKVLIVQGQATTHFTAIPTTLNLTIPTGLTCQGLNPAVAIDDTSKLPTSGTCDTGQNTFAIFVPTLAVTGDVIGFEATVHLQ